MFSAQKTRKLFPSRRRGRFHCLLNGTHRKKQFLAQHVHIYQAVANSGATNRTHKGGASDFFRVHGRLAPDPCTHGGTYRRVRGPTFLCALHAARSGRAAVPCLISVYRAALGLLDRGCGRKHDRSGVSSISRGSGGFLIAACCGGRLSTGLADKHSSDVSSLTHSLLAFAPQQTLDDSTAPNLGCRVVENWKRRAMPSLFLVFARQRSFNWQSTAFVMRGLWVRLPSLALGLPGRLR
jgi:hypothetical protein